MDHLQEYFSNITRFILVGGVTANKISLRHNDKSMSDFKVIKTCPNVSYWVDVISKVNLHFCNTNKTFSNLVKCGTLGLRFNDILMAFTIKTLGGSLFMYWWVCICKLIITLGFM